MLARFFVCRFPNPFHLEKCDFASSVSNGAHEAPISNRANHKGERRWLGIVEMNMGKKETPDALRKAIRGGLRNAKLDAEGKPADNDSPALGGIVKLADVAKRLGGCSRTTVKRYIAAGLLEGFKLPGGKRLAGVWGPSVEEFLRQGRQFTREAHNAQRAG